MTRIVVGVDGSEFSAHALRWAGAEAAVRGWTLTAVMAWDYLDQSQSRTGQFDPDYGEDDARAVLERTVQEALGDAGSAAELVVVNGRPAETLLDHTRPEDLLVVGARGLGGFQRLLLGSTSEQCLQHATSPVVVVRPDTPLPEAGATGPVVVGVDDSDSAADALRWAVEAARAHGTRLEVVHAWRMPIMPADPLGGGVYADRELFEQSGRLVLEQAVGRVDAEGVAVEPVLVDGGAAGALVERSEGALMLVVGSRGLGGFRGLLLGSVSHQVARHASAPTVVVPDAERRG